MYQLSKQERCLVLFAFFTALFAAAYVNPAGAQEVAATISGTVTDASGAVVPNAAITIHNTDTNTDVRVLAASESGTYTATNLQPGNYTVIVKAPGFETATAQGVDVHVAEKRTVNVQIKTGAVTENVTVQESSNPVETSSAAQAGTITGNQVRSLALNNRNFEQLVLLQPGVTNGLPDEVGFGLANSTTISVNGARVTSNNWTVDGADINDSGSNGTLLNVPSIDAIQEFTLARSTYDAQYGRSGGGQVMVATKSGTSAFHGDVYEFVRNDFFNANDFFSNAGGVPRAIERYNNYGFTLGGPLFIPKLYKKSVSKTYFFWSEEWRKTSLPGTFNGPAPTQAELNGVVPGQVNGPAGCVNFNAGANTSTINPSCFSKNAQVYINNVYSKFLPNVGNNYVTNYSSTNNFRQDMVRLDQNFTDKLHFFARFMQDDVPQSLPDGEWASTSTFPGVSAVSLDAPGKNAVGNLTATISPKAVNEAEFAYSWGGINITNTGITNNPSFFNALTNNFAYVDPYGRVPSVAINGFTGVGISTQPYFERNLDRNFFDNFSYTEGNHTLRAGFSAQWMQKTENGPVSAPSFTFNSFGDFLLGNVASYTQSSQDTIPDLHYVNLEGYVQDDWKVTPKLTLNLGLRYSFFPSPSDVHNTINAFNPLYYNQAGAPVINSLTGNFASGQALSPTNYANGLIFPTGTSCTNAKAIAPDATCSPYGSLVNPNSNNNFAPRFGFAYDPFGKGKTAIRGGFGIFYDRTLNGAWEQNGFTNPPRVQSPNIVSTSFDNVLAGTLSTPPPNHLVSTGDPAFKVPSYQDYNVSIQQQILSNTTLEVAYVGGTGRHLLGEVDTNQPTLSGRAAQPNFNVNAVVPYLGYSYIQSRLTDFSSNYNSLQVSLNRRVSEGLTLGLSYTWSKNMTNASIDRGSGTYDAYNYALSYGPSTYNTPHVFVASYVYQLPFFKDQRGLKGHLLGGWEISGITTIQTGLSQTVTQPNDPFACTTDASGLCQAGSAANTYPGGIGIGSSGDSSVTIRPNVAANSISLPKTVNQWFNPADFTAAVGQFGTAGNGLFLGPGLQNWDISGIRNFKIGERFSLQFRGEFFNIFNHTNFNTIGTDISASNFGQVLTAHTPRNVQLGLKLYF
ncbi:MAG TPA: carboxypeptidase regulatory-like domain-containing protein [Bryobacteraceae bacterium]|nr:carboxypeptidase regulatory-like domain-containing protein [Bryobacteraceae bacterium]